MTTKERIIEYFTKNKDILLIDVSEMIQLMKPLNLTATICLEIIFTNHLDDCILKGSGFDDIYRKLNSSLKNVVKKLQVEQSEEDIKYYCNNISILFDMMDLTKELAVSGDIERLLGYKTYRKYRISGDQILIYSVSKAILLDKNYSIFDLNKMNELGVLGLDSEETVTIFGDYNIENSQYLVRTSITQTMSALFLSKNEESHPKIIISNGPAGTGKTETSKDIARLIGKYFLHINGSVHLTLLEVQKFIKALEDPKNTVVIIDEANRSPDMVEILNYVKYMSKDDLYIVCLSCNPGYAGRTEIPTGYEKWTISFQVPPMRDIMRNRMACEGFYENRNSSYGMATFLINSLDQMKNRLPKRNWYDYGLRAVRNILIQSRIAVSSGLTNIAAIKRGIQMVYSGGLHKDDIELGTELMYGYISDITLIKVCKIRHGIIIISSKATGTGVTEYNSLHKIYDLPQDKVVPVIMPMNEKYNCLIPSNYKSLVEFMSPNSEWINLFRDSCDKNEEKYFMFFNANTESDEAFNTLMDDNKCILLENSERINLGSNVKIVLVSDAKNLSPALISRCVIWFND